MKNSRINFRGRHPKLVPKSNQVSVINAKGKQVRYKKKAFLSYEKYRDRRTAAQVKKKSVYRYSGPDKRIKTEKKTETRYRVLQKTKPVYKSFSKQPDKSSKQDKQIKKEGKERRVQPEKRMPVTKQSSDSMKKKTGKTTAGKMTTEKKGYKTLQKGERKKSESMDKKKHKKTTKDKKKKKKTKKKKKDEDKRN